MSDRVEEIINEVLKSEGGYQNDEADSRGNTNSAGVRVGTNFGISAPVWEKVIGRPPTVADMQGITKDQAREVYRRHYSSEVVNKYGLQEDNPIYPQVVDMYVNHSPPAVTSMLQRVYGATADGHTGPKTRAAIAAGGDRNNALVDERKKYYESLMQRDPKLEKYRNGWMDRAEGFRPAGQVFGLDLNAAP